VGIIAIAAFYLFGGNNSKWGVSMLNGVEYSQTPDKPHDCEWEAAPLGNKYCHYEADVVKMITGQDTTTGRPTISYNNGKTWSWNDGEYPTKAQSYITWVKKQD
jgi:hypothetical protein